MVVVTGVSVVTVIGADAEMDSVANDGMGTRMGGGIGAGTGRSCAAAVRARVVSHSANTALFMGTSDFSAGSQRGAMTTFVAELEYSSSILQNVVPYEGGMRQESNGCGNAPAAAIAPSQEGTRQQQRRHRDGEWKREQDAGLDLPPVMNDSADDS